MSRMVYLLSIAFALVLWPPNLIPSNASPLMPHGIAAPTSNAQHAQVYIGPGGGYIGPGVGVVGPGGGGVIVGRPYYGGVWYGTGRRYWRGRWYPYGVGACWRSSPIGYVWVCG